MSKYGNKRTVVDNIAFDSKAEAERYKQLKLLQEQGVIGGLTVQQPIHLHAPVNAGEHTGSQRDVCKYVADFMYYDRTTGREVYEDVKGVRTAMYRLKRKWLKAEYGIDIVEIEA